MAYEFWTAAIEGRRPEVTEEPQEGFYRIRKGNAWLPVALWWVGPDGEPFKFVDQNGKPCEPGPDDTLICSVGFEDNAQQRDPNEIFNPRSATQMSVWLACAKHPVDEKPYRQAFTTGRWHDDAPEAPRGIGDNLPDDPVERIKLELEGEAEIIEAFLKTPITTQEQADQVGPWVDRVRKAEQRAEKRRVEEKAPFLQTCKEIDDKWRFPIARAKELAGKLKDHLLPFLQAQAQARREAARIAAEEELRLREKAAKEQSEAKREEIERQAAEVRKQTVVENPSAGRTGAKVSLRHEKQALITNYDEFVEAVKNTSEIRAAVERYAQHCARYGIEKPGMKIVEAEKAA